MSGNSTPPEGRAKSRVALLLLVLIFPVSLLISAAPIRIQPMGDSITAGYTDVPTWINPYEFGYLTPLYTLLTNKGVEVQYVGQSPEPWNGLFGLPTNTPAFDLRRVGQNHHRGYGTQPTSFLNMNVKHWLREDQPDLVLLMVGINDIFSGESRDPVQTKINLSNLVYTITKQAPEVFVVVAQITPYNPYTGSVVLYNNYIRNELVPHFQRTGANVSSVDQYSNFLIPGSTNIDDTTLSNGYNHPSDVGYARMANTWFDGIYPLIASNQFRVETPNLLVNGGFESPLLPLGSETNFPINSSWAFTKLGDGGNAGIQNRALTDSHLGEGSQLVYLKTPSSSSRIALSQVVTKFVPDHFYELTFLARNGSSSTLSNSLNIVVSFNSTNRVQLFQSSPVNPPAGQEFTRYISNPFIASSPLGRLAFTLKGQNGTDTCLQLDDVQIKEIITGPVQFSVNAGRFALTFAANTNLDYWVESTESLSLEIPWTTAGLATLDPGGKFFYTEGVSESKLLKWFRLRSALRWIE